MATKSVDQLRRNIVVQGNKISNNTIIGDSIVKNIKLVNCYTQAIRGAKILDLCLAIKEGIVQLQQYKTILVHVGTNNIFRISTSKFKNEFETLLSEIRSNYPNSEIIISPIITRPRDYTRSHPIVVSFNKTLELIAVAHKIQFLAHYRHFSKNKIPKENLFSDLLHLNTQGEGILARSYARTLKTKIA